MNNSQIADQFSLLSKLMDIHGENAFKAKTYSIAAFHIEKIEKQLTEMSLPEMAATKGIGESMAKKIQEIIATGKLQALSDIVENTPPGVIELLKIKGLGPKKIHIIWKEMGIQSIGELEYACNENRLTRYKGFGPKTQTNVLESIKFYNQHLGHYLYAQVDEVYPAIKQYLEKLFGKEKVLVTGDYRRQQTTLDKLEFIIDAPIEAIKPKFITAHSPEILNEGANFILYKLTNGLKLWLHAGFDNIYKQRLLTSGSEAFIEAFTKRIAADDFNNTAFENEEAIFYKAGLSFIPAYLREDAAIIEKAAENKIPQVIQPADIKGMIHNHSTWSDGLHTMEEMARHLIEKGFEYLVISDHSKTASYANGLTEERVLQQFKQIDELNKKFAPFKIFKSIESDILNDGRLDYDDSLLAQFDLVIASVHSNLFMPEAKAMERLIRAIENPYTTILGHMTGRLLLSRKGYPLDHKRIIDTCIRNKVAIELNANPRRLDVDWKWIDYILEKGGLISINPDAHFIDGFSDVYYGIMAAQKGGLTAGKNLSSFSLTAFENFLNERRAFKNI